MVIFKKLQSGLPINPMNFPMSRISCLKVKNYEKKIEKKNEKKKFEKKVLNFFFFEIFFSDFFFEILDNYSLTWLCLIGL